MDYRGISVRDLISRNEKCSDIKTMMLKNFDMLLFFSATEVVSN